jgi:hypothetical protein
MPSVGRKYLNETLVAAKETFLVGIKNGHEGDFRQIQAFAKEVDAYKHIMHPCHFTRGRNERFGTHQ